MVTITERAAEKVRFFAGSMPEAEGKRLFATGKNWPRVYEIRLVGR